MPVRRAYFTPALFEFLRDLKAHNNREWFQKNRSRFESLVRDPALAFIDDIGPALQQITPHLIADPRPVGGSLFRINRDVRFSPDKSPYKTSLAMSFGYGRTRHGPEPSFYLQLQPGETFAGGGIYMPDTPTLKRIRDAIVNESDSWKRVTGGAFSPAVAPMGAMLKRPPQGYDADHPLIEDLKRKSYVWHVMFSEASVCASDFMESYVAACTAAAPFMRFLARAVGASW
jgi:uncharacterized protein (TIGR02453 family)